MIGFWLLFIFGLAFGSFFNVLILRYSPDGPLFDFRKLGGRSHCPNCSHELSPKELVPIVSFLFLKGKCLNCGRKISWFYPTTELLTGVLFAGVPLFFNFFYGVPNAVFWAFTLPLWYYLLIFTWLVAVVSFLVIALIDFKYYVVPDELNAVLLLAGVAVSALLFAHPLGLLQPFRTSFLENYLLLFSPTENVFLNHALGAFGGGIFFALLVLVSRGKGIGFGDVKLAFASGAVLGSPDIFLGIALSFILGGVVGALLLAVKRKGMKDRVPYAPFLVLGILITILFGHALVYGYFKLFGI